MGAPLCLECPAVFEPMNDRDRISVSGKVIFQDQCSRSESQSCRWPYPPSIVRDLVLLIARGIVEAFVQLRFQVGSIRDSGRFGAGRGTAGGHFETFVALISLPESGHSRAAVRYSHEADIDCSPCRDCSSANLICALVSCAYAGGAVSAGVQLGNLCFSSCIGYRRGRCHSSGNSRVPHSTKDQCPQRRLRWNRRFSSRVSAHRDDHMAIQVPRLHIERELVRSLCPVLFRWHTDWLWLAKLCPGSGSVRVAWPSRGTGLLSSLAAAVPRHIG
jgi:hypothetical protein